VGEISYQIVIQGLNASPLKETKKNIFNSYGFRLEHDFIKDLKHERKQASNHIEYKFPLGKIRRHDPKGLVSKHCDLVFVAWPYSHERWEDELFFEDARDWDEVLFLYYNF
jgi:hypothetical protein